MLTDDFKDGYVFKSIWSGSGKGLHWCRHGLYAIHPHVEVNVRMTMGIVAHQFYENFVTSGSEGIFSVEYNPSNKELRAQHERDASDYPPVVENGRLVSGYLPLTPVTPKSQYRAYVRVLSSSAEIPGLEK